MAADTDSDETDAEAAAEEPELSRYTWDMIHFNFLWFLNLTLNNSDSYSPETVTKLMSRVDQVVPETCH